MVEEIKPQQEVITYICLIQIPEVYSFSNAQRQVFNSGAKDAELCYPFQLHSFAILRQGFHSTSDSVGNDGNLRSGIQYRVEVQ